MRFVALFIGGATSEEKAAGTEEQSTKLMEDWGRWMERNAAAIVDGGSPLGRTKRVAASGVSEGRNDIVAYTIVEAGSHEQASQMFLDHPHLQLHPGNAIEVMECPALPDPGAQGDAAQ